MSVEERARDIARAAASEVGGWNWNKDNRAWESSAGVVATEEGDCPKCGEPVEVPRRNHMGCRCERDAYRGAFLGHMAEHGHEDAPQRWGHLRTIPNRYRNARFDNFEERPGTQVAKALAQKWARQYSRQATTGLLLVGPFGCGKTHLAVASAYAAIERDIVQPHFCSAATLAHDVKAGKDLDMTPVNHAVGASLLVLDDIGQTGRTEFDRELVYRIVSERYEAEKPIIATSNLTEEKLASALGGALVSRLHEMTEMAVMTAADYRKARHAS